MAPPTPRALLTTLITSIAATPLPPASSTNPPPNPLKPLTPSARPLFTTLHVLFPSLLLPALDLLDRNLVSKLTLKYATSPVSPKPTTIPTTYLVRSAQQPRRHWKASEGEGTTERPGYVVHVGAWSCTCAAFAFSAFPPASSSSRLRYNINEDKEEGLPGVEGVLFARREDGGEVEWEFGGLSLDGRRKGRQAETGDDEGGGREDRGGGGGVPCCKHLLACVLAERWPEGLGRYVNLREVGREEMAGIIADV